MFTSLRRAIAGLSILTAVATFGAGPAMSQENPPPKPIELPCATNASSQLLGATPIGDGSQTLVQARVIFAPGGSIGLHTHPGTLVMTVESGVFGFTHMGENEMTLNRAATDTSEATTESMPHGEEIAIAEALALGTLGEFRIQAPHRRQVQAAEEGVEVDGRRRRHRAATVRARPRASWGRTYSAPTA